MPRTVPSSSAPVWASPPLARREWWGLNGQMTEQRIASATRDVAADAATIFELIADPSRQPEWDGMDNLVAAAPGQRVRAVGDVFVMTIHLGTDRNNRIVEFEEGRRIAWKPSEPGKAEPGHLWRWELEPVSEGVTRVTHTYDWSDLADENRMGRARRTTSEKLMGSIDRLARIAEDG
jgi:uncharacterized protein YndB with AHSA1/START domain